jgi:RecB family exonuclease
LAAQSAEELQPLIARCVAEALKESPALGRSLEQWRQERLLAEWLELERARPPFTVLDSEKEQTAEAGGLRIKTRIDRVDELPDGSRVILDYKTGKVTTAVWQGDRPDEPQVPLYCTATRERIGAAAFAILRKGKLEFVGVAENGALGKMKEMKAERGVPLAELVEDWTRVLGHLGESFRRGVAAVDPKNPGTCDYCDVTAFCRVKELRE